MDIMAANNEKVQIEILTKGRTSNIWKQLIVTPEEKKQIVSLNLKKGDATNPELCRLKSDGSTIWGPFSAHNVSSEKDNLLYCEEAVVDLTKQKQVEEPIRDSEAKFGNLLESIQDAVVMVDNEGRFAFWNHAAERIFGYDSDEIKGKEFQLILSDSDHAYYRNAFIKFRDTGVSSLIGKATEMVAVRKNGTEIPIEISMSALRLNDEWYAMAIIRDITERKKLNKKLRQAQTLEAVGQLGGGIAHNFNNILSVIIGNGQLALMKIPDGDPICHYLQRIVQYSERAAALTQSLLLFSRRQKSNPAVINMNDLLAGCKGFICRLVEKNIEVNTDYTDIDLPVLADMIQIEQAIMNLIANAADAMPDGGRLTIETGIVDLDRESVNAHGCQRPGEYAVISVSDTGIGMNGQTKERIFEPFFTTKETGKGPGLGLPMVYGTIKEHEGFIDVVSEPRKGTTFKIYLPITRKTTEICGRKKAEDVPIKGGPETILMAEDDAPVRRENKAILNQFGYNVIEAVDGMDAVVKFSENKDNIQLVILDVIMPKMNGKDAYEEIKKLQSDIKCIFMSGYRKDVSSIDDLSVGNAAVVAKPVFPKDLLGKVRELLD